LPDEAGSIESEAVAEDRSACVGVTVVGSIGDTFKSKGILFSRFVEESHLSCGAEVDDDVLH